MYMSYTVTVKAHSDTYYKNKHTQKTNITLLSDR
jgi:hypothetical protein